MAFQGFSIAAVKGTIKRPLGTAKAFDDADSGAGSDSDDTATKRKRTDSDDEPIRPYESDFQRKRRMVTERHAIQSAGDGIRLYIDYLWVKISNLPSGTTMKDVMKIIKKARPDMRIKHAEFHEEYGPAAPGNMAPTVSWLVQFATTEHAKQEDFIDLSIALRGFYVGQGLYLEMDKYVKGLPGQPKQQLKPFGARKRPVEEKKMHALAPPSSLSEKKMNAVAPTSSLSGNQATTAEEVRNAAQTSALRALRIRNENVINVHVPRDKFTLQLVNMVSELVITGGVECEAALMNVASIKKDPTFAWLYDQSHPVNHYYRWNLWRLTRENPSPEIFQGQGEWVCHDELPLFEFATGLEDVKGKIEMQEEIRLPMYLKHEPKPIPEEDAYEGQNSTLGGSLNIVGRMTLMHLLREYEINATDPPTGAKIARITAFAILHVRHGMTEIADTLIDNVFQPVHKIVQLDPFEPEGRRATLNALMILSDLLMVSKGESSHCLRFINYIGPQLQERGLFFHLKHMVIQWNSVKQANNYGFIKQVLEMLAAWSDWKVFKEDMLKGFREAFKIGA